MESFGGFCHKNSPQKSADPSGGDSDDGHLGGLSRKKRGWRTGHADVVAGSAKVRYHQRHVDRIQRNVSRTDRRDGLQQPDLWVKISLGGERAGEVRSSQGRAKIE